jgi:pimeloyl-ACP methyl ester carboxylesterase
VGESYSCSSGGEIAAGQFKDRFNGITVGIDPVEHRPYNTPNQVLLISLHGSGGANTSVGKQLDAACSARLTYGGHDTFHFSYSRWDLANFTIVRPVDNYAGAESYWMGFLDTGDNLVRLTTERRLDVMVRWVDLNVPNLDLTRRVLTGGSMGGWGSLRYGLRRPKLFASIYPDRPRWRYASGSTYGVPTLATGEAGSGTTTSFTDTTSPYLVPEDGSGKITRYMDMISYVADTNNDIPWVGWCLGRQDGFANFADHVDAVIAMRAAKRGFAFAWNNGDHSTGSILAQIRQSYEYGTFKLGQGYPLFTNHSGDQDPAVDLAGGINIGLSFRNVVESAGAWSCEVTSVLGARTVTVEPISKTFTATVTPQVVSIPAANTWVSVNFTG